MISYFTSEYNSLTGAERDLVRRLASEGVHAEEWGDDSEGYGHHSYVGIVSASNCWYALESSGCSCDSYPEISGPYDTREDAVAALSDHYRDRLRPTGSLFGSF